MKTTMMLAALFGSSMAIPTSMHLTKRQTAPDQGAVVASINSWNSDVAMVNSFLNTPPTTGQAYGNFASFTLGFARDEPTQLMVLSGVPGLSQAATDAVANLMQVFGGVLTNLQDIIDNQNDINVINQDIANINQIRCCNVLPDLDSLWTSAAEEVDAEDLVNLIVPRETACATVTCP